MVFLGKIAMSGALLVGAAPSFAAYPLTAVAPSHLAMPKIVTSSERQFRTVLRRAISKGNGVVDGGTEHERVGPNFAGAFVIVQWGCGSSCMKAASIDTRDGTVFPLPKLSERNMDHEFDIPTGSADLRTLQFQKDSRLIGLPNKGDGKTYYFALIGHRWTLITSCLCSLYP